MKLRVALIFAAVALALGVLFFFSGRRGGTVVIVDVEQVTSKPEVYANRELRVRGFIKPGSISRYGEKADFVLTHGHKELKVHFDGSTQLPDTFADGAPARADGRLTGELQLVSGKVEAKCASKYDAQSLEEVGPNGIPHGPGGPSTPGTHSPKPAAGRNGEI